jgi:hypothetical protein
MWPCDDIRFRGFIRTAFLSIILGLAGCATTKIISNKDPEYNEKLERVFIISQLEATLEQDFANAFHKSISSGFKLSGINVAITEVSELELGPGDLLKQAGEFEAKTLMTIQFAGGKKSMDYGIVQIIEARFDVSLINMKTEKRVWRADVKFYPREVTTPIEEQAETLATGILNKLKEDGLIEAAHLQQTKKNN